MRFTRELPDTLAIRSTDNDGIRIGDECWQRAIAVTPSEIVDDWAPTPIGELSEADFAALLEHSPELVLLGTGASCRFPPRDLVFAFARRGVGLEVMDTPAAARTFNVLAGEGRRVAAVLYPL